MQFLGYLNVFERVYIEGGGAEETVKGQNISAVEKKTFGCQATGLRAMVVLSYEEWWRMTRRPRSGFRAGRGGGQRQRNVSTCPDLSGPLNNDTLSRGARPRHINTGPLIGLRFGGLLLVFRPLTQHVI